MFIGEKWVKWTLLLAWYCFLAHENLGYIFTEREKSAEIEVEFTGEKQEIAVGKDPLWRWKEMDRMEPKRRPVYLSLPLRSSNKVILESNSPRFKSQISHLLSGWICQALNHSRPQFSQLLTEDN